MKEIVEKEVAEFFAVFWGIDKKRMMPKLAIGPDALPNFSSIRLYQFFAQLESKFKVRLKDIGSIVTFSDIIRNMEKK